MERFLRYSLERQRPIRLMFYDDAGTLRQANAQVLSMGQGGVRFTTTRPKAQWDLPLERLLSADYKKGDEGQQP